jgi:type VI secretion system secreted protein VgrG
MKNPRTPLKKTLFLTARRIGARRIPVALVFALAVTSLSLNAATNEVNLGTANNFAILAGSAITDTGASIINGGNVGLSPNNLSSITGFPPGTVVSPYSIEAGNGVTLQAQKDLTTAYNQAAGLAPNQNLTGQDLGGLTLTPGVYFFSSSAQLTGKLTLNDLGNPDAVFVFQIGSTLTTAADSSVVTINDDGSSTPGISTFWQVGSSATLGTTTDFEGNILALTSITANTGATDLDGRLLARNGAVTLDDNDITAPPAEAQVSGSGPGLSAPDNGSTLLLFGLALAALLAFRRGFRA